MYEAVTNLVRSKLDARDESCAKPHVYKTESLINYDLLRLAYEAYIGDYAMKLDGTPKKAAKIAKLVDLPKTRVDVDDEVPDDLQAGRKASDLRRTAEQIIDNALELARFPIHERRNA